MKIVVPTHNYIRRRGDLTALYLHRLSSGLADKGAQITIVCPHAPGLAKEETIDGVRIFRFGYLFSRRRPIVYGGSMHEVVARSWTGKLVFLFFMISFHRAVRRICRTINPDLIWANWWVPAGVIAACLATKLRLPLVVSSHGTDLALLGKGSALRLLSRYVYRRISRATVVSNYLKQRLLDGMAFLKADQIAVVPMPVGMEHFSRTDPPTAEVPMLLSVARFTRQKRLADLIAASRMVAAEGVPFKIMLVGEGPLENELKDSVKEGGLADRVTFSPLVSQQKLAELYRQSDAVVLISEKEGFGLVLVEAALSGRPAIAARSGGITDIVEDGVNGLLVDVGDVAALAQVMKAMLCNRSLRCRLGDAAHSLALEKFATPVLVDKVYGLFEALVEKNGSNRA